MTVFCWRCMHNVPAVVRIDKVPYCRKHSAELIQKPIDMKIAPLATHQQRLEMVP